MCIYHQHRCGYEQACIAARRKIALPSHNTLVTNTRTLVISQSTHLDLVIITRHSSYSIYIPIAHPTLSFPFSFRPLLVKPSPLYFPLYAVLLTHRPVVQLALSPLEPPEYLKHTAIAAAITTPIAIMIPTIPPVERPFLRSDSVSGRGGSKGEPSRARREGGDAREVGGRMSKMVDSMSSVRVEMLDIIFLSLIL